MELFLFLFGCIGWHAVILALGAWLWAVKPWRLARDYGEFREWQQAQQQPAAGNYRYEEDMEYVG